jgi:formylglycine-generating enzyme required for sulfatase activity
VRERRDWQFPEGSADARWWNNQLTKLIEELVALADPKTGLLSAAEDALSPEHGLSVPRRIAFAELLRDRFTAGGEFAERWRMALPEISAAYPGLALAPQMGLVPIGADPDSGLWELWHVASGTEPQRDRDSGRLRLEESSGVVLVLLPGAKFLMGAQTNPSKANFDPHARWDEAPVHEVSLSAFLLSKYELTQGQWVRMRGSNPSSHQPPSSLARSLLYPLEQVSWNEGMTWLPRSGLSLPSEAQWEYGARGGTTTPWWTGQERESLREQHAANLADQALARDDPNWPNVKDWPELDDGHAAPAPAGTFTANPFGLHETAGNVWEWCLDGWDSGVYVQRPAVDPLASWVGAAYRPCRGGAFYDKAALARSATRNQNLPSYADQALGLRPARALEP